MATTTTMEDMIPASHCMHRDSFQIVHVPQEELEEIAVKPLNRSRQRTTAVANNTTQHQQQLYDREEETLVLRECYRRCYQRSMEAAVAPNNSINVVGGEEKEAPTPATTNLNSVAWDTQKRALLPAATTLGSLDKPASEALFRASANTSCTCETIDTEVSQQSRDICCDQKDAICGAATTTATSHNRQNLDISGGNGSLLADSSSRTNGPLDRSNGSTSTSPLEEDGDQEEEDLATSTSKTRQDLGDESVLVDNSSYGPFNGSTSTNNPPWEEDATSCDHEEEEDSSKNRQDLDTGGNGNIVAMESKGPLDAAANDATSTSSNPTPSVEEGTPQPTASRQELVLITGSSGMGKTALATSLRDEVLADGGFFVSGKCGDQQQQQPFVAALTEWVRQAELREPFLKRHLRARVRQDKDLAAGIGTLLEEVPSLASIVGGGGAASASKDNNAPGDNNNTQACRKGQARTLFAMVFRRFLRIVCSLGRPVVLLIDDLQWANQPSLDLLESLLLSSVEGLLIVGTCRDGEVSVQDPLAQMLRRVEEKGCLIVEVSPPKLGLPALAMMVQAQATHLSVSECTALAHTVLQETKGNALFAQQYIRSLHNDLVIASDDASSCRSSIATSETSFDDSSNSTGGGIQDDRIVRWLVRQMRRLPHDAQYLLQAISCLGGIFTRELLQRTTQLSPAALRDFLDVALHQNLIVYNRDTQAGRFAHDKYQESAYSLLISNPKERALFHLRLGRNLLQSCSDVEQDQDQYLGSIVDLLLVGKEYLTNEEERENLALWCLAVGRKVALKSSFAGPWAIGYIEQGIELLGLRHWRDQYNLSMALYNAAAELAYCQGNHARVGELVGAIKCNARCFMDQVQAHITSMYSLGARGERAMALELGFCVLDQLGYPFPRKLSWFAIQRDIRKTQKMLQKFTEQQIMNLPAAVNKQALIAMTVMQMLHPIYSALRPEYTALTGSRLVQITLECGSTPVSALGFAFYSLSLVRVWRFEDARKYGELALKLDDDKFACREWRSKLFLTLATGPAFLGHNLQYAYDLMKKSHLSGLETGDMETGLRATMCLVLGQTFFGNNLADTLQSTKDYTRLCNEYASTVPTLLFGPCARVCRMLMGSEPVDAELPNRLCAEIKNEAILTYVLITYSFAATYANDLELGGRLMKEVRKRKATASQLIPFCQMSQIFCEGIIAAALGRKDKSNIKVARRRLAKLKELAKYNPQLFSNKVRLLDAEIRACTVAAKSREIPQVMSLYDDAIRSSEEHGFTHEAALACEKAGALLLRCQRGKEAEKYLKKSRVLYLNWGARLKVTQIDEIILSVQQ